MVRPAPRLRAVPAIRLAVGVALSTPLAAQRPDSARTVAPVRVSVTREAPRAAFDLPFAVTRLTADSTRPTLRRLTLGELVFAVPGVSVGNRNNPSQDPRLAIRGFGARSAFGVRGVRVLRDGVPLTLPDGQTPIDWLDLESVGDVELLRGTASALYGNAAGGIVELRTAPAAEGPARVAVRAFGDGNDLGRLSLVASGRPASSTEWLLSATRVDGPGPRRYAAQQATSAFGRVAHTVGDLRVGLQLTAYDSPIGENPGAVTAAELARGTDLADSLNIVRRARKAVVHRQVAITAERGRAAGPQLSAVVFAGTRDLDNPQPFAVVGVERVNWGGSLRGTAATAWRGLTLRSSAGVDWQGQRDDRRNWENCNARFGTVPVAACPAREQERGAVRLDQRERLDGLGAFARWELEAPRRATLSAAVRWDELRLLLTDRLITPTNRDDSGDRTLGAVTPMLGLTVRLRPAVSAYANVSTAFETPTLTELTNQADGSAGLNRALEPQRTTMVESGLKALLGAHWRVELAAYAATTRDELVGFDVPGQVGRRAFRNAGRTGRRGVELAVAAVGTHVDGGLALARARYRYDDYVVGQGSSALRLDGREIPGVPGTTASGWVTGRWRGWFVTAEAQAQSRSALDDANSAFAAGWWVANLRLGRLPTVPHLGLEPVVGIDNLFDRRYASTVVVNATRGRFFEPGVQRTWYAGVRVTGGAR